ncbi:hypothetical protein, partial [Mycobacterium avium]
ETQGVSGGEAGAACYRLVDAMDREPAIRLRILGANLAAGGHSDRIARRLRSLVQITRRPHGALKYPIIAHECCV